jgi:hypothetical protein
MSAPQKMPGKSQARCFQAKVAEITKPAGPDTQMQQQSSTETHSHRENSRAHDD